MDRTLFPSPSEVIVLKISPGSLLKETTGWGQRQSLGLAVSYLACLSRSFSPGSPPPDGMLSLGGGGGVGAGGRGQARFSALAWSWSSTASQWPISSALVPAGR